MIRFNPAALRIFKISVLMMLCCHWMGCTWWLVSELEIQADDGEGARARRLDKAMLEAQNDWQPPTDLLNDDSLGPQYWRAFFWGAGMVTGFVPYDIEPVTEVEVLTTVVCMFLGVMINAVVIGSFTSALSSMDSKKEMCREKLETIGQYLIVHNVSSHLRNSILEYYEYLLTSSQSMEEQMRRELRELPPTLASRLALTVNRRIVTRCPFFKDLTDAALMTLLSKLRPQIYAPGQVLVDEGQLLRAIYFINKGVIHLLSRMGTDDQECVAEKVQYENFGIECFEKPGPNKLVTYSARAVTYADVMSLSTTDLARLLARDDERRRIKASRAAALALMKDPKAKANGSGLSWRGKLRNAGRKLVSVQKFQAAGSSALVREATAQGQADSEDSPASPVAAISVAEIARLTPSPSRERRNSKALLVRETSATPRACADCWPQTQSRPEVTDAQCSNSPAPETAAPEAAPTMRDGAPPPRRLRPLSVASVAPSTHAALPFAPPPLPNARGWPRPAAGGLPRTPPRAMPTPAATATRRAGWSTRPPPSPPLAAPSPSREEMHALGGAVAEAAPAAGRPPSARAC